MIVTAVEGSDAWRYTNYGFVHDSEHALLHPLQVGEAVEVTFSAVFPEQFDQAGVFIRANEEHWVKAGIEHSDGVLQLGAVVTAPRSDWSLAQIGEWSGERVTVRVSRGEDSLTIRAGVEGGATRLVRVVPFQVDSVVGAGPFVCAPTRAGLSIRFHSWMITAADGSLH